MSRNEGESVEKVPLTDDDIGWFHRHAPAALQRRSGGSVSEEMGITFEFVLMGLTPIAGMIFFDWSARELLLFLLAGAWVGFLCDAAKITQLRPAIESLAQNRHDDWHVWLIAEALRKGQDFVPRAHLQGKFDPNVGLLVDALFGSVSMAVIYLTVTDFDADFRSGLFDDRGVIYGLAGVTAYQVLFTIWEIVDHKGAASKDRGVKIFAGLRGAGLLFLMFLSLFVHDALRDNGAAARTLLLCANGGIILLGLSNPFGLWMSRGDTAWLRDHLAQRGDAAHEQSLPPT